MHEGKKLPPGWIRCESRKFLGACYFFDTQTGTSRWFPPAADTPRPAPAFIPHSPPSSPPPLDDDEDDETVVPQPPVKRARPGGTSAGGQPAVKASGCWWTGHFWMRRPWYGKCTTAFVLYGTQPKNCRYLGIFARVLRVWGVRRPLISNSGRQAT